ncbi:MAG TPA: hypothetical protein VM599_00395, partial [Thermoanaerobaculia bacterium]|nr:hypothetical protein [Thermoanaerobaculia bacterium]
MPGHAGGRPRRALRQGASAFALLLCLSAGAALAQPTVNGLFYGDGDDAYYVHWATSELGSKLYVYLHVPTTTLYVALVVDRSVNDNVFGASDPNFPGNYMVSAGWGAGAGQQRSASALTNSEFATFEFACEEGSPRNWAWQQGYACLQSGTWVSDQTCGASSAPSTWPPSIVSSSSWVANINTYQAKATPGWSLYGAGAAGLQVGNWSSPDRNVSNNVNDIAGYPTFSAAPYDWEWSMV